METKGNKIDKKAIKLANLYPFVESPRSMEQLKASKAYILWEKAIDNPSKLTRDEKDWIAGNFLDNVWSSRMNAIPLGGWMMVFPFAKKYLVQDPDDYRRWRTYMAFDKTSLRKALYNRTGTIMEFPKKETK